MLCLLGPRRLWKAHLDGQRPLACATMANAPFDRRPVNDPAELGIDATALDELFARAQKDIDERRIPSCQIALARDGRVAVWRTLGDARPESRYVIFSATKPVVAGGIWILMGEGLLDMS